MFSYNFVRSGAVTGDEFLFLSIVNSFSRESHLKLADYSQMMGRSKRTVKRIIKSLKDKGFLAIRYGLYKSLHIAVDIAKGVLWKANLGKNLAFSKGPNMFFKRAKLGPSNIESNKEKNKELIYFKENWEEEHPGGKEIPVSGEIRDLLNRFLGR